MTECRGLAAIEQDGRLWLVSEGGKLVDTAPADDAAQYAVADPADCVHIGAASHLALGEAAAAKVREMFAE